MPIGVLSSYKKEGNCLKNLKIGTKWHFCANKFFAIQKKALTLQRYIYKLVTEGTKTKNVKE